jgi:hypothetical protein
MQPWAANGVSWPHLARQIFKRLTKARERQKPPAKVVPWSAPCRGITGHHLRRTFTSDVL